MSAVVEITKALMRCPSITPDDAGCQQIVIDHLSKLGFLCETLQFENVTNLWAKYGKSTPLVVFAGHTDVVPVGTASQWLSPPFAPEVRDDYLYGRGACDMKASIGAMLIAVEKFIAEHPNHNGSIALLLTSDEEGPALNGTQKVIDVLYKRGEKIDYCIVGEPSSDKEVGDQIRIGRRGSLHGHLIIKGIQGHVAHPHLALNPIHQALLALHQLTEEIWDNGNEYFPQTTFQISNIHAGTGAANVIPGTMDVHFNFRFGTAVPPGELQSRTHAILNANRISFDLKWTIGAEPFLTKTGKLIEYAQQVITTETGLNVKLSTAGGTSDGRFIAPRGVELIELGPSHESAHHINERVRVDDLERLVVLYYKILQKLLVS